MFIIALVLFVGGIFLIGISFSIVPIQALVFIAGLLAISAAIALPVHFGKRA